MASLAEADLNWVVTERSDSQFAGRVYSWTRYLFADLLNPEMQLLKSHLYQLSNANFALHCKWIFSLSHFWLDSCRICWPSVVKDNRLGPNRVWTASLCSIYCCLCYFVVYFYHLGFLDVETASEMTKTMLEWVFYLLTLVNISFVNWPEQFILSLNQKNI